MVFFKWKSTVLLIYSKSCSGYNFAASKRQRGWKTFPLPLWAQPFPAPWGALGAIHTGPQIFQSYPCPGGCCTSHSCCLDPQRAWWLPLHLQVFVQTFLSFWLCGILVPWPGIKPVPPATEARRSSNHWTAKHHISMRGRPWPNSDRMAALLLAYQHSWSHLIFIFL